MSYQLNKTYPLKVWILTSFAGPYLGVLLNLIREPENYESSMIYAPLYLGLIGLFISLPAFIMYYFIFSMLGARLKSEWLIKFVLYLISCIMIVLIFFISDLHTLLQPSNKDGFLFFLGILFTNLFSGFIFKIYRKQIFPIKLN